MVKVAVTSVLAIMVLVLLLLYIRGTSGLPVLAVRSLFVAWHTSSSHTRLTKAS